jgi:hypothetical protein
MNKEGDPHKEKIRKNAVTYKSKQLLRDPKGFWICASDWAVEGLNWVKDTNREGRREGGKEKEPEFDPCRRREISLCSTSWFSIQGTGNRTEIKRKSILLGINFICTLPKHHNSKLPFQNSVVSPFFITNFSLFETVS